MPVLSQSKRAAIKIFTVNYNGIRIKVRLLPTARDVHREYTAGKRRRDGKTVHAFFDPKYSPSSKYTGTMVLPLDGRLEELIPHEVVHAVMSTIGGVHCSEELMPLNQAGLKRLHAELKTKTERVPE